jgi:hypothetical protein
VSALISVSDAKSLVTLSQFNISNSTFYYGKAIEIKAAKSLEFKNSEISNNSLS